MYYYSCTNDKLKNYVVDPKAAARKVTGNNVVVWSFGSASRLMATANRVSGIRLIGFVVKGVAITVSSRDVP